MSCFCCIVGSFEMLPWKMNQKSYKICLFRSFSCRMWAAAGEKSKDHWLFSKYILFSKQNKTVFWGEMPTNGRKRYFHIDENASSKQIYASLDNVDSADGNDIDNLVNDSDTDFIAEEEITQAASTHDTSLTTPEANLHVVPTDNQSKKKEKNKDKELWEWTKKVKVAKQEECHLVPEIQPNFKHQWTYGEI